MLAKWQAAFVQNHNTFGAGKEFSTGISYNLIWWGNEATGLGSPCLYFVSSQSGCKCIRKINDLNSAIYRLIEVRQDLLHEAVVNLTKASAVYSKELSHLLHGTANWDGLTTCEKTVLADHQTLEALKKIGV